MDYKHSKETISQDTLGFGDKSERAEREVVGHSKSQFAFWKLSQLPLLNLKETGPCVKSCVGPVFWRVPSDAGEHSLEPQETQAGGEWLRLAHGFPLTAPQWRWHPHNGLAFWASSHCDGK